LFTPRIPSDMRPTFLAVLFAAAAGGYPNGSRVPNGNAGEPGTGVPCSSCHNVTLNPAGGRVTLSVAADATFMPGAMQRWTVSITDPNSSFRRGFQLTATAGAFAATAGTVVTGAAGSKQYVNHTASSSSYAVDWIAPTDAGTVTVYVAAAAAGGTRQTNVYTASVTLTRASARPVIRPSGVIHAAHFRPEISPGAWVTVFGSGFAPAGTSRTWSAADVADGKLPVALDGTKVRINGRPAAIAYMSETQLNVQAPDDDSLGVVAVEVETPAGVSDPAYVELRKAAPGFFRYSPENHRYVAAVHADGTLAGPAGLFGGEAVLRPAQPGETLLLFGTGFGPTQPAVAAGTSFSGAMPLAAGHGLSIRIGGVPADVPFAGLAGPGLYQFNLVVPDLPDGEHSVEAEVFGASVPSTQFLSVKR